jgi:hypothetical protein
MLIVIQSNLTHYLFEFKMAIRPRRVARNSARQKILNYGKN